MKKIKTSKRKLLYLSILIISISGAAIFLSNKSGSFYNKYEIGQIDSPNGVYVYYNAGFDNIEGRNLTADGYNIGLKYQCVEWVKRYYYEHLDCSMPNSYGHAKVFFNASLRDGKINKDRDLIQFLNPSNTKPEVSDLIVFDETNFNKYEHVAIVTEVDNDEIEIIQQNVEVSTREKLSLNFENDKWQIINSQVLGWMRVR